MHNPLLDQKYSSYDQLESGSTRCIVPFVACGDLNSYDSDKTYPLVIDDKEYNFCAPVNAPINPPYATAKLLKTNNQIAKPLNNNDECTVITAANLMADIQRDLIAEYSNLSLEKN